ncbi:hypothetical protein L6164_030554 [Bauhinia variegata]|uniref:Uncharacterized protein n=1 Tax=Bauhinia variegata TaxID=167791 RepID=A0ACB9LC92_BAUVA|nr:hypothetical protein L6164_030554 [Bauhinia variegata]
MSSSSSNSNSPCAACKLQRRKCTQECVFAPYFPPDNPQKFAYVHKVFGASNVAKLLNELNANQREDAVKSLAYEAEARLRDPVYGCVGLISVLQQRLKQVQAELTSARRELANYIGPQAMLPMVPSPQNQQHPRNVIPSAFPYNNAPPQPMMGIPTHGTQMMIRDPQQILEGQQLAVALAAREQEMTQQQQQELFRFNGGGYEVASASAGGFNHMSTTASMSPSLALGPVDNAFQIQPDQAAEHQHPLHHQLQAQLILNPQQPQAQQTPLPLKSESEDGGSSRPYR